MKNIFSGKNKEIFLRNDKISFLSKNGITHRIPEDIKSQVLNFIETDEKVKKGAMLMDLKEKNIVKKFLRCNFSTFNLQADIRDNVLLFENREFVNCAARDSCPGNGLFCKIPGDLTPRELEYAIHTGHGLADCEISAKMNISQHTVHIYRRKVEEKIKARSKLDIVRFIINLLPMKFIN